RAFAQRQAPEAMDVGGFRQSVVCALFQRWAITGFLARVQPKNQFDRSEQLLVIRTRIAGRTEGRLLHAPHGSQNDAALGAIYQHRCDTTADMAPALGLAHERQEEPVAGT